MISLIPHVVKNQHFYEKEIPGFMCKILSRSSLIRNALILMLLSGLLSPAASQNSYSDQTIAFGEDEFFPYTRGRILKNIEGENAAMMEQICRAIISWDSLNPPKGFEIRFNSSETVAQMAFLAYVMEGGLKTTKSGPTLNIYINDPVRILGSPVAENIFLQPEKVSDFYGCPVYRNTDNEVTVIYKARTPLFVPVTREEYLQQLIRTESARQGKEDRGQQKSDSEIILEEMEKSYRDLLKVDPDAAAEFKIEIQKFRADMEKDQDAGAPVGLLASLKAELEKLSPAERKQPALYSVGAFERYGNFSGLVPESGKETGAALVRLAPEYAGMTDNRDAIKILILSWNVGSDNAKSDKPRLFQGSPKGFQLADYHMARLYHQQKIWNSIISLVL